MPRGTIYILFLVTNPNPLFSSKMVGMKTWHIAGLVIVGLIVAAIAYGMYDKSTDWGKKLRGWWSGFALFDGTQVPKKPSNIPGGEKINTDRPGGPMDIKELL